MPKPQPTRKIHTRLRSERLEDNLVAVLKKDDPELYNWAVNLLGTDTLPICSPIPEKSQCIYHYDHRNHALDKEVIGYKVDLSRLDPAIRERLTHDSPVGLEEMHLIPDHWIIMASWPLEEQHA